MYLQIYTASHRGIIITVAASDFQKNEKSYNAEGIARDNRHKWKNSRALCQVSEDDVWPTLGTGAVVENESLWMAAKYVDISYECSAHFPKTNKCDIPWSPK